MYGMYICLPLVLIESALASNALSPLLLLLLLLLGVSSQSLKPSCAAIAVVQKRCRRGQDAQCSMPRTRAMQRLGIMARDKL